MTTRLSVLFAVALLAVTARAEAQFRPQASGPEDYHVELGVMFWQPDPELTLTTGDVNVGTVDFVQEFGIGKERFRDVRAVLKGGRHKVRFGYTPIRYDQDAVLTRTITFQNVTFPVTADANANINWDVYRFGYEFDIISRDRGFLGIVGELKYNKVKADVTATGPVQGSVQTLTASVDEKPPIPTVGVAARGYLAKYVSVSGEFTAFKYENDEFIGKFYDFDIQATAHLGRNLGASVGYRSLDVDFLVDGDAGTMKMKGPYVGGFLRF